MKTVFAVSFVAQIILLLLLYAVGRRYVLAGIRSPYAGPAGVDNAVPTAMIVPVTGDAPETRAGLQSLLGQDYPNLRYVFVTSGEDDPATALIRELIAGRSGAVHVTSGQAVSCGQKNHNLLAGLEHIRPWAGIYLFCDATHRARPDLARLLVEPLAQGKAVLSGGFHRVVPLDGEIPTLGMVHVCLVLHCLQSVRPITLPWGGAMAITRQAFELHDVASVWRTNIVDDFSMGPHLVKKGIRTWPVALACLETPLAKVRWEYWRTWLVRQLQYLKFCTSGTWFLAAVPVWLLGATPVLALGGILAWLAGAAGAWWLGWPVVYLAAFFGVGALFRGLSPRAVPMADWLKAFFVTPLMTAWCYLETVPSSTMRWRGIAYKVGWGGVVKKIIRN